MVMHRPIKGTPKTAIVKRTPTGKWFVNITVELREEEARAQRKLSQAHKGSREREQRRKVVARVHERIRNRRTNFIDKAEEAGRAVVRVNPAYTSQTCSACRHRQPMPLSVRVYACSQCGLVILRDHNGSKNILQAGLQACGRAGRVVPEAPSL
jgi:putative transposase